MFNNLVWATDGSENADRALSYVKSMASGDGARVTVVHVAEFYASHVAAGLPVHANEEEVQAKLKKVVSELSDEGIDATLKIVSHRGAQPAHEIADIAEDIGADLIVVGTRGHTPLAGLLVGSVTQRLLHLAECPVLAVPPAA
jgi:nucleotide-binding universal stress UspA family protein